MRRDGLFWGTVLIVLGGLLLLGNLNLIRVNWGILWAAFLILLGVWFLVGPLILPRSMSPEQASIPLDGAGRAEVKMRHGAGRPVVSGGAEAGVAASGTFVGGLDYRARRDGEALAVKMRIPDRPFFPWMSHGYEWTVALTDAVPLALDLRGGASETRLDLSNLRVTDLRLEMGASSTELTLPARAGYMRVKIEAGASSVQVTVPGGVAARVRAHGGAADISVDGSRFPRTDGGVYQSLDYDSAANKVDLEAEIGAGALMTNVIAIR